MNILQNVAFFVQELLKLSKTPVFISLTLIGNGSISLGGALFYYLEVDSNPKITHFIDAIWWSFSTATTTGYGDITPVTIKGKLLGIFLMLMGMALFATYTALFADSILSSEKFKRK